MAKGTDTPPGRYGSSARGFAAGERGQDARRDRALRVGGAVLGVLFLVGVVWIGFSYVTGQSVSGELIKFRVASDRSVQMHLEVRKDADVRGVCTVRAQATDGAEVGRRDVTFAPGQDRVDTVVTLRTTSRATSAELVGCTRQGS